MYVDTSINGHHLAYMSTLANNCADEKVLVLPEKIESLNFKQYVFNKIDMVNKKIIPYYKWMKELEIIAKIENPDIIHFLMGDDFYKYFGLGLELFSKYKIVLTLHWVRPGSIKRLSLKCFGKKVDRIIVHSQYLLGELQELGLNNGVSIEYPQFKDIKEISHETALMYWGLSTDYPVVSCIGGTRKDKGLDILLDSLCNIKNNYQLLIAGKSEDFDNTFIMEKVNKNKNNIIVELKYLTDEEVDLAIEASDIIALPYRFCFNGASGPLGEGVSRGKCIVGPNHGSLAATIQDNHLGYVFETENPISLAEVIDYAVSNNFKVDNKYLEYKDKLNPTNFIDAYRSVYNNIHIDKV